MQSWLFGVACGIAIGVAAVPFGVSYVRYQHLNLCDAYAAEAAQTIPHVVREYLIDKPLDSFMLNLLEMQRSLERAGVEFSEELVAQLVEENGNGVCYGQMYLNVARPQEFTEIHSRPLIEALNGARNRW